MEIHNINEDLVLKSVNEIFDDVEHQGKPSRPCTCFQCRLDTACYVLNRILPRYIVSSRGVERVENESMERQQTDADIVTLVWEGMERIGKNMRPHHLHAEGAFDQPDLSTGPSFNFPTIIGRVFNGGNFEPLIDIEVSLHRDGVQAQMIDPSWQNPYKLVANTAGTFSFWPLAEKASVEGLSRTFEFSLIAQAPGFDDLRHFFEITLTSERETLRSFNMQRTFKLPDLYLFPPAAENDD